MSNETVEGQTPPASPVITVTNDAELEAAIRTLAAGDGGTVLLDGEAAPYSLSLSGVRSDQGQVALRPLDPDVPPVIASMELTHSSGISVQGMDFRTQQNDGRQDIRILSSRDIEITGNTMQGLADGYLSETGTATSGDGLMLLRDSQNIVFSDNTVSKYFNGLGILDSTGLQIENNSISQLQGDGIHGGGWQDTVISGNHIHDFYGSTATINHADMIQIWGLHTKQITKNVEISGNFLDAGAGAASQGIFIRNEAFGKEGIGPSGYFEDIAITDNVVYNGVYHGIALAHTDGATVSNNTVLWNPDAAAQYRADDPMGSNAPWLALHELRDATATGNIANRILVQHTASENVFDNSTISYENRGDPMFVGHHFTNWGGGGGTDTDARDLMLRSDSTLLEAGQGAQSRLVGVEDTDGFIAVIQAQTDPGAAHSMVLSAGLMSSDAAWQDMSGADIRWTFADGTTREGATITQGFGASGPQDVTLEITTAGGTAVHTSRTVTVEDNRLLHLDFDGPLADLSDFDGDLIFRDDDGSSAVAGLTGGGLLLDNQTSIWLDRHEAHLFGLDKFSIEMAINPRSLDARGEILSQHAVFTMYLADDGGFGAWIRTDAGEFGVRTGPEMLTIGAWQKIGVHFDDAMGTFSLTLDGEVVAEAAGAGSTRDVTPWGTTIGRAWANVADAVIDDLIISRHMHDATPGPAPAVAEPGPPPMQSLIDFGFDGDYADVSGHGTQAGSNTPDAEIFVTRDGREGVQIGGGSKVDISRDSVHLSELDGFDIDLSLALDSLGARGGLLTLHTILDLDVMADGALRFTLNTDAGSFTAQTGAGALTARDWHDLRISYSDEADLLAIRVDGTVVAETHASGTTAELSWWPLVLGENWGHTIDAMVDRFAISAPGEEPAPAPEVPDAPPGPEVPAIPDVQMEALIDFGFDGDYADVSGHGTQAGSNTPDAEIFVTRDGREGVQIGGGSKVDISRDSVHLSELDGFDIDLSLALDSLGARGGLLTLHTILDLDVMADGALRFTLNTDAGSFAAQTGAGALTARDWHDLRISYSDEADLLAIRVDGTVVAETHASGTTAELSWWPLVLGENWGHTIDAMVDRFAISAPLGAEMPELVM